MKGFDLIQLKQAQLDKLQLFPNYESNEICEVQNYMIHQFTFDCIQTI